MKRNFALSLLTSILLTSCNNYTNYPEEEYKDAVKITANGEDCTYFSNFIYDDMNFSTGAGKVLLISKDLKEVDINIEFDSKYVESVSSVDIDLYDDTGFIKNNLQYIENDNQFTFNLEEFKELHDSLVIVRDDKEEFIREDIPFVEKIILNAYYSFEVIVNYTSGYKGYYVFSLTYGIEAYWEDGSFHVNV